MSQLVRHSFKLGQTHLHALTDPGKLGDDGDAEFLKLIARSDTYSNAEGQLPTRSEEPKRTLTRQHEKVRSVERAARDDDLAASLNGGLNEAESSAVGDRDGVLVAIEVDLASESTSDDLKVASALGVLDE